ncbi:MAG: DUF4435 domain-containing protein [Bacteroidaceae bacterium]|nr:DUF4435 domain-containing protein [Bacteroidaceae bacterium]
MGKRLTDNITSRYIEAANRLRPNRARRRVVAYVESYDDVLFWRQVLDEFETDRLTFEVMLPSRTNLGKGKKYVLANRLGANLGGAMIACVDADYDYLMQGATPVSRNIIQNPFIFHTYVYAIENYQCYARGLHEVCVMSTLNDREMVDLEGFMAEYSRIVWPLFVWSVWVYRYDCYSRFTLMDFAGLVSIRDVNPYHPERTLETLRRTVNRKINWMQQHYPEGKKTYKPLKEQLLSMGLTPETTYLYMQGHAVMDGVIIPLLTPICSLLRKEREAEIRRNAVHSQQRQNELSCYQRRLGAIDQMLRKSTKYLQSEPFRRLHDDLRQFAEGMCPLSDSPQATTDCERSSSGASAAL